MSAPKNILCVASHVKGFHFMREAHRLGCRVHLLTHESLLDNPWPRESLVDIYALPNFDDPAMVRNVVSYLSRSTVFDALVPMGDYDVEVTATLREHLRLPGMGVSASHYFRDKLAMRQRVSENALQQPAYTGLLNDVAINDFMAIVPGPWVLKPRAEASSKGIQVLADPAAVWQALDDLADARSLHLLEAFVEGDLYHVDGVVNAGNVVFESVQKYGLPLLRLRQVGGVYSTATVKRGTEEHRAVVELNRNILTALALPEGVFHVEYLRDRKNGQFYFVEAAARVGAAKIADVVFFATGVCVWREWARLVAATPEAPYQTPIPEHNYAGVLITVTGQEQPDTSAFNDPEIIWRQTTRPFHAGLLVKSADPARVQSLLDNYVRRFERDFSAHPHHA